MIKYQCSACDKKVVIKLMPDYCSDHIWCSNPKCGVGLQFEIDLPKVPKNIVLLVETWGALWDAQMNYHMLYDDYFRSLFTEVGSDLANQINKYYECSFNRNDESNFFYMDE